MWSLYEKKEGETEGFLDKYSKDNFLKPLKFSNGKTQEDIVKEVLEAISQGHRVIFIKGGCGTGKSAIALNISKELGKSSIVVPIKSLQKQYEEDYTSKKYILKKNGGRLKIKVITGRQNHHCPYEDCKADNPDLPCCIEIKNSNFERIKEYIEENKNVRPEDFTEIKDVKRSSIAPICEYWSPIIPSRNELQVLKNAKPIKYEGLGENYTIYKRKEGCSYYNQFDSYADADVLIFNSYKYLIETAMNRKPKTQVDIIDECDEFLDRFSNERSINLNKLKLLIENLNKYDKGVKEIRRIIEDVIFNPDIEISIKNEEIFKIKDTKIKELFNELINSGIVGASEDEDYIVKCFETAKMFEECMDETYISFFRQNDKFIVKIVSINLESVFNELMNKTKILILMSGTIHSEKVLREIFGIQNFKIIDAETEPLGSIKKKLTGEEINCKYDNFSKGIHSRKDYLMALEKCMEQAEKPCLVHVTTFYDLPSEKEAEDYGITSLITRERLIELQDNKKSNELVKKFKSKQIPVLFTTKCSRGIDFPGNQCNSIIITKYPYPDINSIFWKVLKQNKPKEYNEFYLDKARREVIQKIYRGLRFKEDKIDILSPDIRVFWNTKM